MDDSGTPGIAQAHALREQSMKGGLRFEAYLPPGLADWLLEQVEHGVFADPSEAIFVIFDEYRELVAHADLRRELPRRTAQAAIDDPGLSLSGEGLEKHWRELVDAPVAQPAVWRKTP